eukprot:scaffold20662_cov66-Phaeocystis_antarctica.AAC.13
MVPSHRTTATPVSSHEVSIPSTVNEAGSCGGAASTESGARLLPCAAADIMMARNDDETTRGGRLPSGGDQLQAEAAKSVMKGVLM